MAALNCLTDICNSYVLHPDDLQAYQSGQSGQISDNEAFEGVTITDSTVVNTNNAPGEVPPKLNLNSITSETKDNHKASNKTYPNPTSPTSSAHTFDHYLSSDNENEDSFELHQTILNNNNSEIQFRHDNLKKQQTLRLELPRANLANGQANECNVKFYCDSSNLNNTSGSMQNINNNSTRSSSGNYLADNLGHCDPSGHLTSASMGRIRTTSDSLSRSTSLQNSSNAISSPPNSRYHHTSEPQNSNNFSYNSLFLEISSYDITQCVRLEDSSYLGTNSFSIVVGPAQKAHAFLATSAETTKKILENFMIMFENLPFHQGAPGDNSKSQFGKKQDTRTNLSRNGSNRDPNRSDGVVLRKNNRPYGPNNRLNSHSDRLNSKSESSLRDLDPQLLAYKLTTVGQNSAKSNLANFNDPNKPTVIINDNNIPPPPDIYEMLNKKVKSDEMRLSKINNRELINQNVKSQVSKTSSSSMNHGGGHSGQNKSKRSNPASSRSEYHKFDFSMEILEQFDSMAIGNIGNSNNNWSPVPFDKVAFKIRQNQAKRISIKIKSLPDQEVNLPIDRCFGVLLCAGKSPDRDADMHLLEFTSKLVSNETTKSSLVNLTTNVNTHNENLDRDPEPELHVIGEWDATEIAFKPLNQITNHGERLFISVAVDVVMGSLEEPVRFLHETKIRVFPEKETFWNFGQKTLTDHFTLTVVEHTMNGLPLSDYKVLEFVNLESTTQAFLRMSRDQKAIKSIRDSLTDEDAFKNGTGNSDDEYLSGSLERRLQLTMRSKCEADKQNDLDFDEPLMSGTGDYSLVVDDQTLLKWATAMQSWRTPPGSPSLNRNSSSSLNGLTLDELPTPPDNSSPNLHVNVPDEIKKMVPLGIPGVLRKEVWARLADCAEGSSEAQRLTNEYQLLHNRNFAQNQIIERDLHRTFPANAYFKTANARQDLFGRVLSIDAM